MPQVCLITGATGFIGSRLVAEILTQRPEVSLIALVLRDDVGRAKKLQAELPLPQQSRFRLIIGDITKAGLGLTESERQEIQSRISEIFHLAAFYRLDVTADTAWRVNYLGTREVAHFALACPALKRFHHFSSLVAGSMKPESKRPFLNDYERTKYLSEVLVRESLGARLDSLNIFRPGVVVGDSQTGVTDKFDGLYFGMQFLWRYRKWLRWLSFLVQGDDCSFPVVPVDFVVKSAVVISKQTKSGCVVYPLVEDQRVSWPLLYIYLFKRIVGKAATLHIRPVTVDRLCRIPGVARTLGFPRATLAYVNYEIPFDLTPTRKALEGSGIEFPRFWDYADRLIEFFLAHAHEQDHFLPPREPRFEAAGGSKPERFPFADSDLTPERSNWQRSLTPET